MSIVDLGSFRAAKQKCEAVENTDEKSYTLSGDAICSACGHEWVAEKIEAPVIFHECPSCHSHRGVFKGPVVLPENALVATCKFCQGQLFMMTSEGHFCVKCGGYFTWDSLYPSA